MALVLADRVKETTTTTGTGTYTLAGAVGGFETFASVGDGNTTYYCCTDGTDFEVGLGTYTASGTTLARTTILQSSNSDAAVNWAAGTRTVFCTIPGEKLPYLDASGNLGAFNGSNLTALNASNLSSGTVSDDRLPASISSDITGNAATATALETSRTIELTGDVTGSAAFDGTGNASIAATLAASGIPSGSVLLFQQTAAPTGFTKITTHDDKALRVVSGTAGSGGTTAFSTAMATPSVSGSVGITGEPGVGNLAVSVTVSGNIANHTLSQGRIPAHSHSIFAGFPVGPGNLNSGVTRQNGPDNQATPSNINTGNKGSNQTHNHGHNISGSGNLSGEPGVGNLAGSLSAATAAINVNYVDIILASKD